MAAGTTYKAVVLGDARTGKTAWALKLITGKFEGIYKPTLGVEVHPFPMNFGNRVITFNLWDTAGQERYGGLRDGYFIGAHVGFLFVDPDNLENVSVWTSEFNRVCPDAPIVYIVNQKNHTQLQKVFPQAIFLSVQRDSCEDLENPFRVALSKLEVAV